MARSYLRKTPNDGLTSIGDKFGRLMVVAAAPKRHRRTHWQCQCECGTVKPVSQKDLRRGTVKSCGCLRREVSSAMLFKYGAPRFPEHSIWTALKSRIFNPHNKSYPDY